MLTLAWLSAWYFAFLFETLDSKINLYTDNIYGIILGHVFILVVPIIAYIILILVFKIFLWIIGGFREDNHAISQTKVRVFAGEGSFFELVKKHKIIILSVIIAAILIGIFISFTFTSYNSYDERRNARGDLQFNFGDLPPLPKLPALPKIPSYIPVDER